MVPNPKKNSRGGRASRESSGRLADVEFFFPRMVSVRLNTGETFGSSLVQRQKDALMAPNPKENSRGDAFPETALEGWRRWKRFHQE